MHKGILLLLDLCVGHFWTFIAFLLDLGSMPFTGPVWASLLSLLDLCASLLPLLDLCGLIPFHFWTWVGMMPLTSGPVWAWCLTSGPVWASLLSFWTGLDAFHWTCVGLTCVPLGGLEKTPCQTICCLFLCAAFSFERPAPTRGLFPQEAFSHHRKMIRNPSRTR